MENKIKEIMSLVFEIPVDQISNNSAPETIEKWDSIRAINLIVALEESFDVEFSDEEIADMLNFQLIKTTLKEKIGE